MNVRECLEEGLLKRDAPNKEKADRSIEVAWTKIEKAKELLKVNILDMAEVNVYGAMFHAARALLYKDGMKERSHYAIYVYLKENYGDHIELKFLNELNLLRLNRHEVFYGLEELELNKESIKRAMMTAEEFIHQIRQVISRKYHNGSN